ncbi:MAG: hypothetical protein LW650_14935 [Planctomycetaceae bacterium]|nr:hypothetical protein [Phycisphaerales bacterium]MCE2654681.1 hypothetical protein [Planctomycetaceae bacterium]
MLRSSLPVRLTRFAPVAVLAMGGAMPLSALAQVVPPAPPAPPPTAPFEPPPPPPPAPPAPPPAPEVPAPDLIKRDANGRVIPLTIPTEDAALAALGIKPEAQSKADQVRLERRALLERHLTRQLASALKLRAGLPTITDKTELGTLMGMIINARDLVLQPTLVPMMQSAGVFGAPEGDALKKAVDGYIAALGKDTQEALKDQPIDVQGAATARVNLRRIVIEPMREFNTLLARAAENWASIKPGLDLKIEGDAALAAEKAVTEAKPEGRADAMAKLLEALPGDKAPSVLEKVWTAFPETRLVPDPVPGARPGTATPTIQPVNRPTFQPSTAPGGVQPGQPAQPQPTQPK